MSVLRTGILRFAQDARPKGRALSRNGSKAVKYTAKEPTFSNGSLQIFDGLNDIFLLVLVNDLSVELA